jgi:hypothetical protein
MGSLATATLAHVLICIVGYMRPNAYGEHAHDAAIVVALVVATVASVALVLATTRALSGRVDVVLALARDSRRIEVATAGATSALGGALVLAGIESLEQVAAFGHVGTVADLFGGSVLFGACAIFGAAFALATIGHRIAAWVLSYTASTARTWLEWIATSYVPGAGRAQGDASCLHRFRDRIVAPLGIFNRSHRGLRAPPPYDGSIPT